MFSRAGLDLRRARVILIYAKVRVIGGTSSGWANVLRFRSGDLAWYCKNPEFLCWGLRVKFEDFDPLLFALDESFFDAPRPRWDVDCEQAVAWRAEQARRAA